MVSPDSLDCLDPQALPDPQDLPASEETLLPRCLTAMTRNPPEEFLCPAPWVLLVPEVFLAPLVHLVPKVSKAPLVNPASLEPLVPWVPVVPLAPLARMEMTVKLASPVAPVSVALLDLRVLGDCPELLVSPE